MRNRSVISKNPNVSVGNKRATKIEANETNTIKPATKTVIDAQDIDLRALLYSPEAEAEAREIAAQNQAKRGPFDPVAFHDFVSNHPLFSKLHLAVGEDED